MEYLHRCPEMAIGAVENALVVGWLGSPSVASARALEKTTRILCGRHPNGIVHLNLVTHASRPTSFGDDARKIIVGLMHDPAIRIVASTTVFGGGGFVAATIRGVLASLTMLSRSNVRIRFVGSLVVAEDQLRESLGAAGCAVPQPGSLVRAATLLQNDAETLGFTF